MKAPSIYLKPGRDSSVRRQHPWIFSGAIDRQDTGIVDGDIVRVHDAGGTVLGCGFFAPDNIAVKMLHWGAGFDPSKWINERIGQAVQLRERLGLFADPGTTGFRLVHAEGDCIPGLIVDLYGRTAVLQTHASGTRRLRNEISLALQLCLGERLSTVFHKEVDHKDADAGGEYLLGTGAERVFCENGNTFRVDWERGQKTGFFLDQRENRKLLGALSRGKNVLNCFSYTGGFSVYAGRGGASAVTSVDSSASALALLQENINLNGIQNHRSVDADCLQYLQHLDSAYDVIVLDPPAFIKHRGALRGGIKGYETINHLAMKQIAPGGLLFTFSCSQLLSRPDFADLVARAALRANRSARVLFELRQGPCHPVSLFHPEGEYLKGLVLEIR